MVEIYGSFRSRTRRVIWAALELGIDFDHIPFRWDDPALKQEEFLRINPLGRIPALKNGDFQLSESLAINLYLAKTRARPESGLYPADPNLEALVWQWSFFAASDLDPWVVNFGDHSAWLPQERRNSTIEAFSRKALEKSVGFLEVSLNRSEYLAGDHFTIADLNAASVLQSIVTLNFSLTDFPRAKQWLDRNLERPAAIAARDYK